jgi:hypothetical protein
MSVGTVLCVLVVAIVAEPRPVAHVREGLSQGWSRADSPTQTPTAIQAASETPFS